MPANKKLRMSVLKQREMSGEDKSSIAVQVRNKKKRKPMKQIFAEEFQAKKDQLEFQRKHPKRGFKKSDLRKKQKK